MRADAQQDARLRAGRVPGILQRRRRVMARLLQIATAEMVDLAERTLLDQVFGQAHSREKAVVETTEVLHPRLLDGIAHRGGIAHRHGQRLLADDVLAGLRSRDRRRPVPVVRGHVINDLDARILHHLLPVGIVTAVAHARRSIGYPGLITATDGDQIWERCRRGEAVRYFQIRVGVHLTHTPVAEHTDPNPSYVERRILNDVETFRCHTMLLSPSLASTVERPSSLGDTLRFAPRHRPHRRPRDVRSPARWRTAPGSR